jgi:hypothetical protein
VVVSEHCVQFRTVVLVLTSPVRRKAVEQGDCSLSSLSITVFGVLNSDQPMAKLIYPYMMRR